MDSIRALHFIPNINALISASEDCTIKIWDTSKFSNFKDIEGVPNFEPYLTFRGHFDPILSLAGRMNNGFN
jgi:WD40 repeat protein